MVFVHEVFASMLCPLFLKGKEGEREGEIIMDNQSLSQTIHNV